MPASNDLLKENKPKTLLDKFRYDNKVVVITGGAGILGRIFAQSFLEAGAKVAILDINEQALAEAKAELAGIAEQAAAELARAANQAAEAKADSDSAASLLTLVCNLTDKVQVAASFAKIVAAWGRLDVLVNNAAAKSENFFEPVENYFLEDWQAVLDSNLTSMFLCAQGALQYMQKQKSGAIINLGSIYGVVGPDARIYEGSEYLGRPINTPVTYAVTKGAVPNFSRYLAVTQAPYGIRVNTVCPGGVYSGQNETFLKNYSSRTPLARMANPEEIAAAVIFLASDAASYITGQNLMVDGGWTAW